MGDLAFGRGFDKLKGEQHLVLSLLTKQIYPPGLMLHAPWLYILYNRIRGRSSEVGKFVAWFNVQVEIRRSVAYSIVDYHGVTRFDYNC